MIVMNGQPPVEVLSANFSAEDVFRWTHDPVKGPELIIETNLMGANWPYPLNFAGAVVVVVKGDDGGLVFYEVPTHLKRD